MTRAHPFGRVAAALVIGGAIAVTLPAPRAADPQPYTVTLGKTGNSALDAALSGSSDLISLRETAPVGPFALVARARNDLARFQTALQSFSYFDGRAEIRILGHPIDDPALVGILEKAPASPPASVAVNVVPGPQFHIRHVAVEGEVPSEALAKLGLQPGAPAVAASVLAAQQRLLSALRDGGYALAKVDLVPATVDLRNQSMDVAFKVTTGPRVDIGPITFQGLDGVNESFVRRRFLLHQGEQFSPTVIDRARADLARCQYSLTSARGRPRNSTRRGPSRSPSYSANGPCMRWISVRRIRPISAWG